MPLQTWTTSLTVGNNCKALKIKNTRVPHNKTKTLQECSGQTVRSTGGKVRARRGKEINKTTEMGLRAREALSALDSEKQGCGGDKRASVPGPAPAAGNTDSARTRTRQALLLPRQSPWNPNNADRPPRREKKNPPPTSGPLLITLCLQCYCSVVPAFGLGGKMISQP